MAKGFGVSPLTGNIYYGTLGKKSGTWANSNKIDVTDDVIKSAFQWFQWNFEKALKEEPNTNGWRVTYENSEYELVLMKKNKEL